MKHLVFPAMVCVTLALVLSACGSSIGGSSSDAVEHYNAGVELKDEGRFEDAKAEFDEAIRLLGQDLAPAFTGRGEAYMNLGEFGRAIEDFGEAMRFDPGLVDAYMMRGHAYMNQEQFERAIEDFDQAMRLGAEPVDAYISRGNAYSNLGQFELAIQDFDEAIRLEPELADAYASRALAHIYLGMDAEAAEDADRAVEFGFNPDHLEEMIEHTRQALEPDRQ